MIHKTTRSILSVLLAALLLVTSVPLTPAFAGGGGVSLQSESAESGKLTQDGDDTYLIYTAENLKEFAAIVNGTHAEVDRNNSANARLMNDIDLSSVCSKEKGNWTPIGNSESTAYTGTFNGNGKTISGLYIDSRADYQGLFGYVSGSGKIEKLTVSGSVSGNRYVGGVVGYNGGNVENCYNTGAVNSSGNWVGGVVGLNSSGIVKNCTNTGEVSGPDSGSGNWVGGVVGNNHGRVENCYNIGEVSGNSYVGGVVGLNSSFSASVTNCYNTGKVSGSKTVGGVVGSNTFSATVTNCYNTGNVSGLYSGSDSNVGGVVGLNSSVSGGSVTDCYFLKTTGVNESLQGIGSEGSATGAAAVNNLTDLCDALKGDTWTIHSVLGRPVLNENKEGGLGTEASPYEISTADELENFRNLVNNGIEKSAHAKLMNDINLSSVCGESLNSGTSWEPIGTSFSNSYSGTFDGDGHTISGLTINSSDNDYKGLFGYVGTRGTVQNLSVSGSVSGNNYVGGIAGRNNGTVTNCYNTGAVNSSGNRVGGVVGYNSRIVKNCYNTGAVNSSGNWVGGVVGVNSGSVTNCYNTVNGTVTVTGNDYVGGVVGYNSSNGTVENCYNTVKVTGSSDYSYIGGVVGWNRSIGNVTNCYFLKTADVNETLSGIGSGTGTATEKDDTAFHSGEVAWRLQAGQKAAGEGGVVPLVWGQSKLGETTSLPTLNPTDEQKVYQVTFDYGDSFTETDDRYDYHYANANDNVTLPTSTDPIPEYEGHTLTGWQNEDGQAVTEPITVTADTTYTAKWTPHTYSITASPSALDFGSITEGEERPAAQNVMVKNTGNQTVTLTQPTANNFEITTSDSLTLAPNASATFTIQPKDKLPRGSYSEQITISGNDGASATLTASFTVKEPPYTGKYSYEVFTSVGDNGTVTVDRYATEGDKVTIDVTPDQAYKLDDLSVTAHGKDVELTANSDGTYTFTMPSADVKITATFAEDPDWTPDEPEEPTTDVSDLFSDIAPNAWYKDAVQYAYDNGLMTGVSATEFDPEATTTRAMIVSILARLEGVTTAQAAGFADVDDNDWYATAVNWAANVGVVNGYEDNTFRPNTAITREQLAAILMNYAAYKGEDVSNRADLTSYTDQPSTWAEETMSWAVAEGLISGVTADTLQPQGAATRAQVAAILQRFLSE